MSIPVNSVPSQIGRYLVQQTIGQGSMGVVLLARDPLIDRNVAIKLIQTTVNLDPEESFQFRERFRREAKAAGNLQHPGIVTVFDAGETDDGVPYLVMEYISGITLREMLLPGPLPMQETFAIGDEILDALAYAHAHGVVHRDIKPSNILVLPDHHIKITDFGVAYLIGSDLTKPEEFLGTPYFMSPEQIAKHTVDHRTDLFSFGVVLYQMLTGKRPFIGDSLAALTFSILQENPVPPHKLNPAVSPGLSMLTLRCLSKVPEERYAGAPELRRELLDLQSRPPRDSIDDIETVSESVLKSKPASGMWFYRSAGIILLASMLFGAVLLFLPEGTQKSKMPFTPLRTHSSETAQPELQMESSQERRGQEPSAEPDLNRPASSSPEPIVESALEPFTLSVSHSHTFGACSGLLTLSDSGIYFRSESHSWRWEYRSIKMMDLLEPGQIRITTYEDSLVKTDKSYNFLFERRISAETWNRFRRQWLNSL